MKKKKENHPCSVVLVGLERHWDELPGEGTGSAVGKTFRKQLAHRS